MFVYNKSTFLLHIVFYVYISLLILKSYFHFNDGVQDIVVMLFISFTLFFYPIKLGRAFRFLFREAFFKVSTIFVLYFIILTIFSYNSLFLIFLEFLSIFKWLIYFFLGYLFSSVYNVKYIHFPLKNDMSIFVVFLLVYSALFYNWSGIGGVSELFGFYGNSFESLFSLRSVFALFAFLVFVYALNYITVCRVTSLFLLSSSFIFLFMSGNRKMLLAVLLVFMFMNVPKKFKKIMRVIKLTGFIILIAVISKSSLFQQSITEYSNIEQPRIATYRASILIAKDFFPFGSGPATFASKGSMTNYSYLYEDYDLDTRWGFRPDDEVHFYNDTYWAQVISQYGLLGVFLILWILFEIKKILPESKLFVSYKLQIYVFLLISLVTPALQRIEVALFVFFVIGIITQINKRKLRMQHA